MASLSDHTHHIRIRSTQMEMPTAAAPVSNDDYDRKLREARSELERIQQQREELERKKIELEELASRKRAFVSQQAEWIEKLTSAITLIDRQIYELRNESQDLEQCRVCFAGHLDKIEKVNPDSWTRENTSEKLDRASMSIELAADEYDQAASHFEGSRSGAIFGRASKRSRNSGSGEFAANLRNGFAFNLPIMLLGGAALVIYLIKTL
jgi:chromosome segregation ATPase